MLKILSKNPHKKLINVCEALSIPIVDKIINNEEYGVIINIDIKDEIKTEETKRKVKIFDKNNFKIENKPEVLSIFSEKNGIYRNLDPRVMLKPAFLNNIEQALVSLSEGKSLVAKRGKTFVVLDKNTEKTKVKSELNHFDSCSELIDCKREYLVPYFSGATEKILARTSKKKNRTEIIKSGKNGFSWTEEQVKIPQKIKGLLFKKVNNICGFLHINVFNAHIIRDTKDNLFLWDLYFGNEVVEHFTEEMLFKALANY